MGIAKKPEVKLSQWDALSLESLKMLGWSGEELITRVHAGNLPKDESKFAFDYTALTAFAAEHQDIFAKAVHEGYQIKYNTIRGIHSWILIALKHEAELVLEPGSEAVIASLSEEEAKRLESVLSFGWRLNRQYNIRSAASGKDIYRVAPVQG